MAKFERSADVVWTGNREGVGKFTTASGLIKDVEYKFPSRFGDEPGSNPEELIAAAHAACFTQFMIARLTKAGFKVNEIKTHGICTMNTFDTGDPRVTKLRLETQAKIEGIDDAKFQEIVADSKKNCPISEALSAVPVEVEAKLV